MSKDCSQIVLVGDSILSPPLTTPLLVSKGIQHSLLERLGIHPIFLETNPNVLRKIMELPHLNWKNQNWRKDRISLFFACSLQNDEIKEERYPNNDYNFVARYDFQFNLTLYIKILFYKDQKSFFSIIL